MKKKKLPPFTRMAQLAAKRQKLSYDVIVGKKANDQASLVEAKRLDALLLKEIEKHMRTLGFPQEVKS